MSLLSMSATRPRTDHDQWVDLVINKILEKKFSFKSKNKTKQNKTKKVKGALDKVSITVSPTFPKKD